MTLSINLFLTSIDIACRHSALLGLLSALGALGRRFESCRPDSLNPSHTSESTNSLFYLKISPRIKWIDSERMY